MSSKRSFPLIQTLSVPKGDEQWEAKRLSLLLAFINKVPEEYYIPQHYIDNPPRDVTSIPRDCGILTDLELEITENYDAVGLANAIARRKYTAVQVAKAYLKRAIICDQISCCLAQWLPDLALERAKELDEHLARTGKTVGPLHGVPVSIKQHMPIANTQSDLGFVSTTVDDTQDCLMVALLRRAGAVFYVKTLQPQSIMHLESDNHFGRALNPYNINLSPGGSTGGDAALNALRGSVLGVGTDIGGSIRGPAGKCGIYGFKPTAKTLTMKDMINGGFVSELNILCSTGPLCRSLRDMDFFMHVIQGQKPHLSDPSLVPIPWTGLRTDAGASVHRPLKVGIMLNDGVIQPQPPVLRALQWAKFQLQTSPLVSLRPYKPYRASDAVGMIRKLYWPDGGQTIRDAAAATGEPLHSLTSHIIADSSVRSPSEMIADHYELDKFRAAFAEDWTRQDVDVVICPVYVGPAPAHDTSLHWNYTAIWNLVDYPGVVVPTPIKALAKGVEAYADDGKAWNEQDAHVRQLWQEVDYEGAPIALQIVARRFHDNYLFGALDVLKGPLGLVDVSSKM